MPVENYNEFSESNAESMKAEIDAAINHAKWDLNDLKSDILSKNQKETFKTPDSINNFYRIENWKIIFKLDQVKSYLNDVLQRLDKMKNQRFSELSKENNFKWTILAIQIVLKAMWQDVVNPKKYDIWKFWDYDSAKEAIKQFQSDKGISRDGKPWKQTIRRIISSLDNFIDNRKEYTHIKNTIENSWKLISEYNVNKMTNYIINWNLWTNTDDIERQIDDLILIPTPFNKELENLVKEYKENGKLRTLNQESPFRENKKYDKYIIKYSKEYSNNYKIDPALIKIMMNRESQFDPLAGLRKNSRNKKAKWLMQLTPGTAKDLKVNFKDPEQNIKWGIKYMGQLLDKYNWNIPLAVAAYNAGPWNVKSKIPSIPETKDYVNYVMGTYNNLG